MRVSCLRSACSGVPTEYVTHVGMYYIRRVQRGFLSLRSLHKSPIIAMCVLFGCTSNYFQAFDVYISKAKKNTQLTHKFGNLSKIDNKMFLRKRKPCTLCCIHITPTRQKLHKQGCVDVAFHGIALSGVSWRTRVLRSQQTLNVQYISIHLVHSSSLAICAIWPL